MFFVYCASQSGGVFQGTVNDALLLPFAIKNHSNIPCNGYLLIDAKSSFVSQALYTILGSSAIGLFNIRKLLLNGELDNS